MHGVIVADHIKAKSRGGRLPDWKDCAVDMIAKGSSLGYVFLIRRSRRGCGANRLKLEENDRLSRHRCNAELGNASQMSYTDGR